MLTKKYMRVLHKDLFELFQLFLFSVTVKLAEKLEKPVENQWFKELSPVLYKNASSLKSFWEDSFLIKFGGSFITKNKVVLKLEFYKWYIHFYYL